MTQKELYVKLSQETGRTQADAKAIIEALGHVATDAFKADKGEKIVLPGIGTIKVSVRAARTGKNPRTGEIIDIPESARPVLANVKTHELYKAIN